MRILLILFLCAPGIAAADCVILLHGLARSEVSFAVLDKVLAARGYDVVRPGYASTEQPIQVLVDQTLPQAMAGCGAQTVHVVAHSMGGILLRYWLVQDVPDNLGNVVMLGTPNQGSQLVDVLDDWQAFGWLNGPAGQQLGTGPDGLIHQLPPVNFSLGVIAGTQSLNPVFSALIDGVDDGKVAVSETRVDGMRDHISLSVTHTFMMNSPRVIAETVYFIETGGFHPKISWLDAIYGIISTTCLQDNCEQRALE